MFEFIQAILTRTPKAKVFLSNSMASRHLKTTMFFNFSEKLECPQFPRLPLLRCQNFLRIFLPFRSVGFCLRAFGPSGRGSRGDTPLHFAAYNGHVSAVARLIEAKAAVDAETNRGRGLGTKDLRGKTFLRQWDLYVRKWMKGWFDWKF